MFQFQKQGSGIGCNSRTARAATPKFLSLRHFVASEEERDGFGKFNFLVSCCGVLSILGIILSAFVQPLIQLTDLPGWQPRAIQHHSTAQGDTSRCSKPPVDFKSWVPFWPGLALPGQAKAELLFWSQQEVLANVMCHPVQLTLITYCQKAKKRREVAWFWQRQGGGSDYLADVIQESPLKKIIFSPYLFSRVTHSKPRGRQRPLHGGRRQKVWLLQSGRDHNHLAHRTAKCILPSSCKF